MAHDVIPKDADRPQALYALVEKRAEIAGQVERLRTEIGRLAAQLDHIDATIAIFAPDLDIGAIRAKPMSARHAAYRGEVTRLVFRMIREANGSPVTANDIVDRLMEERGLDPDNRVVWSLLRERIRACLRMHKRNGFLRHAGMVGNRQGWELVR